MNASDRNAIIIATEKIVDMGGEDRRKLLLTILGTSPTTVLRALKVENVRIPAVSPNGLYKVAITDLNGENRKINVIKCVREITGYGLADAKAWSEGGRNELPSGVFGHHLTLDAAKQLLEKVKTAFRNSGNLLPKVEILTDGYYVKPLPDRWSNGA